MAPSQVSHRQLDINNALGAASTERQLVRLEDPNGHSGHLLMRHAILRDQPLVVGASWAECWFKTMLSEGRSVSGGWPGTVPEARFRARLHCDHELKCRGLPSLSQEELAAATATTYERAKHDWLQAARGAKVTPTR